ncbi:MAG: hypothetical protein IT424_09235 [Pirellulales bacterium]|nr:hypothetical protein [Pirellulales bacterium]
MSTHAWSSRNCRPARFAPLQAALATAALFSAAYGQGTTVYTFEPGLQGFGPNGGGVSIAWDTIGATEGEHSMKMSIVQGATFVGTLTAELPPEIGDPPGLDFVIFDLTITEPFPAEGFIDAGITVFGASQPDDPNGQQFGLQAQFFDNQFPLGDLPAGTHEVRMDLTSTTHPLTFATGQSFNDVFGTAGSGPLDIIPTGFQIYINKSSTAPWTGYIDNIRVGLNPPALDADFNDDQQVDAGDLSIWGAAFGVDAKGDADGDLDSDGDDMLVWQRQFGPVAAVHAVPEPAAGWLAIAAAAGLLRARRRSFKLC